jgi:hypothetical protein
MKCGWNQRACVAHVGLAQIGRKKDVAVTWVHYDDVDECLIDYIDNKTDRTLLRFITSRLSLPLLLYPL